MVHAPESVQDCIAELDGRNRCVRMTRNTEAVKNYPGSVRAVKCIKVNTRNVVIQKIVALFQRVLNADAPDHLGIVLAMLQSAEKRSREARAARQLGHAFASGNRGNRHDSSNNRDVNLAERTALAEIEEVAIIKK